MASLMAVIHICFSSDVSASSGNVRVGVFRTNAFSPPPNSSGAFSSTEKPSADVPITISPSGNASCIAKHTRQYYKKADIIVLSLQLVSQNRKVWFHPKQNIFSETFAAWDKDNGNTQRSCYKEVLKLTSLFAGVLCKKPTFTKSLDREP